MDSFELNKILGAVLGTGLVLLSLNIAAGAIFATHEPHKPGFEIVVAAVPAGAAGPVEVADEPLPVRFAKADVAKGEQSSKKCQACHTLGKGEPNRVGPNLWGVVGRQRASEPGFNYSAAMKSHPGNWTPEELDVYLKNPRGMVPGTNMTFAGIPRASERADLITFLNSHSDKPVELPKATADATKPAPAAANAPAGNAPAAAKPAAAAPAPKAQ